MTTHVRPLGALLLLAAGAGAASLPPVLGWNTWCTQNSCGKDWCSSKEVLSVGAALKESGMLELGFNFLNLDDCWGQRNPDTNHIEAVPERFPQGMAKFVEEVHALGFRLGVYTDMGVGACTSPYTGSWPYYEQDAADFASWGVDYVKFDYCGPPAGHDPADLTANMSAALAASSSGSGRATWFNFHCNWLTFEDERCAEFGNSFRIAPDHIDAWYSTLQTSAALQDRKSWWGPSGETDPESGAALGYPDPDFVFTGGEGCGDHSRPGQRCPQQTDDEYRSEWALDAIASGQLLIASDPRNMSALQREVWLNEEILNVFKDTSGLSRVAMVSSNGSAVVPPEPDDCGIRLSTQLSHGDSCVAGATYGCLANDDGWTFAIWAADGCRGLFECYGVGNVDCESSDSNFPSHQNISCACAAPVPQVWVRPLNLLPSSAPSSTAAAAAAAAAAATSEGGENKKDEEEEQVQEIAVVLFNAADDARDVTLSFDDVEGWDADTVATVRDLWRGEDEPGTFQGSYTALQVPPHASLFLRLDDVTPSSSSSSSSSSLSSLSSHAELFFDVTEFGATGDGVTDDTAAFEAALVAIETTNEKRFHGKEVAQENKKRSRSSSERATLFVPGSEEGREGSSSEKKYTYLIRPLNLTSDMVFKVGAGATVLGLPDASAWPLIEGAPGYGQGRDHPTSFAAVAAGADGRRFTSLLHGEHLTNVGVVGEGASSVLDGQGQYWWAMHQDGSENHTRGHLVELMYSQGVELGHLTLRNSPFWTTHFYDCDSVHVHHVYVTAPDDSPNTDGFDPDSSRDVLIEHSTYAGGDDCVAIKSGWDCKGIEYGKETSNVHIRNLTCTGRYAGIAIGSELSGGVFNVMVEDVQFVQLPGYSYSCNGVGHVKWGKSRGGAVQNVTFKNMMAEGELDTGVFVTGQYNSPNPQCGPGYAPPSLTRVRDLEFLDIDATAAFVRPGGDTFHLFGLERAPATGLSFRNVHFGSGPGGDGASTVAAWNCAAVSGQAAAGGSVAPWPPCDAIDIVA